MRQLYLAATGQNRGKTTTALGLFDGFVNSGLHAGFIKPVGQRTVIDDGQGVFPDLDRPAALERIATNVGHSFKRNLSPAQRQQQMQQERQQQAQMQQQRAQMQAQRHLAPGRELEGVAQRNEQYG